MKPLNLYIDTARPGVAYSVRQIGVKPLRFIAYVRRHQGIVWKEEPLHREGLCILEALNHIGRHCLALEHTLSVFGKFMGKRYANPTS